MKDVFELQGRREGTITVEEILASISEDERQMMFSCAEHNPLKLALAMGLIEDGEGETPPL
jgi:hypothetical protein